MQNGWGVQKNRVSSILCTCKVCLQSPLGHRRPSLSSQEAWLLAEEKTPGSQRVSTAEKRSVTGMEWALSWGWVVSPKRYPGQHHSLSALPNLRAGRKLMDVESMPPLHTGSQSLPTGFSLQIKQAKKIEPYADLLNPCLTLNKNL